MAALWQQTRLIVSFNWQVRLRGWEVNVLHSGVKKCPAHSRFFARFFALKCFRASNQLKCLSRISQKTSLSYVLDRIAVIQPHWRVFRHLLKVMPHHLNHIQVLTLTRPLQSLHFVFHEPSRGGLGSLFCCRTQVPFSWRSRRLTLSLRAFFLVDIKIHGSTYHNNSSRSWSSLISSVHRVFSQMSRCFLTKLFAQQRFLFWTLPCRLCVPNLVMKNDLHWGTWDLQFLGCCCRVLCDFLDEL